MKQILVTRSSMPSFEEYMDEIRPIWENHWLTNMGPKHAEFADALRAYLGVERIDLFTNGHMAIELTLRGIMFLVRLFGEKWNRHHLPSKL